MFYILNGLHNIYHFFTRLCRKTRSISNGKPVACVPKVAQKKYFLARERLIGYVIISLWDQFNFIFVSRYTVLYLTCINY